MSTLVNKQVNDSVCIFLHICYYCFFLLMRTVNSQLQHVLHLCKLSSFPCVALLHTLQHYLSDFLPICLIVYLTV